MKKHIHLFVIFAFISSFFLPFSLGAIASNYGTDLTVRYYANSAELTIHGAPNSDVELGYYDQNNNDIRRMIGTIGSTNNNGIFLTTIINNSYGIPNNARLFVIVRGEYSPNVIWQYTTTTYTYNPQYPNQYSPYNNTGTNYYVNGGVTFSQNNITIAVGQTSTLSLYGGYNYYVAYDSSPVIRASVQNNTLNVYGVAPGSATLTICSSANNCGNLYVTADGYRQNYQSEVSYTNPQFYNPNYNSATYYPPTPIYVQSLVFTIGTTSVRPGQTRILTINDADKYYLSTNSQPAVASASIHGNSIYISGGTTGGTVLTICEANTSSCGTISVVTR